MCVFTNATSFSSGRSSMWGRPQHSAALQSHSFRQHACCQSVGRCLRRVQRLSAIAGEIRNLPIFPLGLVAFPSTTLPLQIFEARYRVLFSTLLADEEGIDEGLVQEESPYKSSREFGVSYATSAGIAAVGTVMRIQDFAKVGNDGVLLISNTGMERYRIRGIIQSRPVVIAEVEMLEDAEDTSSEAKELVQDIAQMYKNILQLNVKMKKYKATPIEMEPEELTTLPPRALSFWLGSQFQDSQTTQQALLEEDSTVLRLQKERDLLKGSLQYLQAAVALDGLSFSDDATPPPGGPD